MWPLLSACLVFCVLLPAPTAAQRYQRASDGLVAVHVRRIVEAERPIGFTVCAQLMRQEQVTALEVRLNFWGKAGGILAQASSILRPGVSAPVCRQIPVPQGAKEFERWEISRFRIQRQPDSQPAAHRTGAD